MPVTKRAIKKSPKSVLLGNSGLGVTVLKQYAKFRPQIRSRHSTHKPLRSRLPWLPFRSIVRLGSTTVINDGKNRIELNAVEAIRNSSSKFLMKACFDRLSVKTAKWLKLSEVTAVNSEGVSGRSISLRFPVVFKLNYGSRGRGMKLARNIDEYNQIISTPRFRTSEYLLEEYMNYVREYRLHVHKDGCFYTCRKVIKNDTAKENRWYRNDSNCNWLVESNPGFDKPVCWEEIVKECVKALKSIGLDFGACDVRVQSAMVKNKPRKAVDFFIVEINSAPSFGEGTLDRYLHVIPDLLKQKKHESS